MNQALAIPWDQLKRYETEQLRYLRTCLGRESDPVIPFGGPVTTVRADPSEPDDWPADALHIEYVARDGEAHLEMLLGRGDLRSLGIGPWIHQIASIETLREILADMLEASMRRAALLTGGELTLRVQRLEADSVVPEMAWPAFVAEAVPRLGRLRFKMSPALIAGCEAHPMPRRGPGGMPDLPLIWDVRLGSMALAWKELRELAAGDVVRVLLSPLPQAEVVGALVPHRDRSFVGKASLGVRRRVKVLIDAGGWISLRFGHANLMGDTMEDNETIDGPTVPVSLTLPVATMSLREIDSVEPGTLVDTGVRLQDVEVALWTGGQRFASGRLVVIGEYLGVEIARTERDRP